MPDDGSLCPLLAGEGDVTSPETLFVRYEFGGEHTYRPSLGRIWGRVAYHRHSYIPRGFDIIQLST